jgi:hypothetical protein
MLPKQVLYHLRHAFSPFCAVEDSLMNCLLRLALNLILLISASKIARITGAWLHVYFFIYAFNYLLQTHCVQCFLGTGFVVVTKTNVSVLITVSFLRFKKMLLQCIRIE